MPIKLSQYAKNIGISYSTAYRWFKNKTLPAPAIQTSTGTILVDDSQMSFQEPPQNTTASVFLNCAAEFSQNNASIEDFATYIATNFSLIPISTDNSLSLNQIENLSNKGINVLKIIEDQEKMDIFDQESKIPVSILIKKEDKDIK